ncbi:hypothetical protein ACWOA2_06580 [Granulicatella elegans]|uniref:DUF2326 domain-containing protein n=1 Tax=Granulicatella elegans ATCC 700633 TaxID=626369 RepID=D0BNM8_9LACT|nr:hypothetical protein [Granulicatella elegans]EEW92371.1 hypothetical protein HMPREF0446_01563 [Granulicatella elegans ATCC 700633]
MNVIFKKIYIFDILTKKAFVTSFEKGVNIVTSSSIDGTDRGKSVLLRSLYHVMGADAHFDKKWKNEDKVYLLEFFVDNKKYFIYRHRKLFKVFNDLIQILFQTSSRTELSEFLGEIWSFEIFLPNRNTEKLEIAPPAYTYVMNFLDQDYYDGTNFNSFKSLGQYRNFKPDVIYSQLGIYDKSYFERVKIKQNLFERINDSKESYKKSDEMKGKVSNLLENVVVPENLEELERELSIRSKEYNDILHSMNEFRYKLTNLRNEKYELEIALNQIERFKNSKEKEVKFILETDICPQCHSFLNDTTDLRSKRYNSIETSIYISDSIYEDIEQISKVISKIESSYREFSNRLESYKKNIDSAQEEIKNYTSYIGLNELYNSLNLELFSELQLQEELKDRIENIEEELKKVSEIKADINNKYYEMVDSQVLRFGLNELEESQYKAINRVFCASGSNKPISTVIWYFILNNLKVCFNKKSLKLPMVLDSPKNAEMDYYKEQALIEYILENSSKYTQLIFSSIGFERTKFIFEGEIKIIELKNDKYQLLNSETFKEYEDILENVLSAQLM